MSDDAENKDQESDNKSGNGWLEQLGIPVGKKKFWSSDKFLSLLAFLISIGTFSTFAYQTYLIQKQQYANVLPYLSVYPSYGNDYFRLEVANNGVGPAFIQDVVIHYRDSSYTIHPNLFIYNTIHPDSSINFSFSSTTLSKGSVVPSERVIVVLESNNKETADLLKPLFLEDDVNIELVYSSIFDEKWRITYKSALPEKID